VTRRDTLAGLAGASLLPAFARAATGRLLHRDDFRHGLGQWQVEAEAPARVSAQDGSLDIEAPAGLTLWFRPLLKGPVEIRYRAQAVAQDGPHDRVSDLNCFWMAHDPTVPDGDALTRPRSGKFEEYDSLQTYYVGLGGNGNSTTRFRRYVGRDGDRPLLPENDRRGSEDMLVANRWQDIVLIADGDKIAFLRDGRRLFAFQDDRPYTHGRFALRTTASHLKIRDFTVRALR
jgi:hypothetical protein